MKSVAIIGLGIMGGSLGYSIKEAGLFDTIKGCDNNIEHQVRALELGIIDEGVSFLEAKKCDLIVIATPVDTISKILPSLQGVNESQTIVDLGSTKYELVKNTPQSIRKNFVAAHPMCGTEKHGPEAAIKDLYKNKIVVLCDVEHSGEHQLKTVQNLFNAIGSKIVYMDAREHDKHAAFISHLPHAISFALANSVLAQEDPKSILALAAGGFKDMSRVAKSSSSMWTDIFKQNREFTLKSIESYKKELNDLERAIEKEDWEEVSSIIERANRLESIL